MTSSRRLPYPWWLWPNLLALDAPAVALVWQSFLADCFAVPLPPSVPLVLVLIVWGIYLLDHLLDGKQGEAQPRHRFAATHPRLLGSLFVLTIATVLPLSFLLPTDYFFPGCVLSFLVVAYLILVHVVKLSLDGSKELLVGILFGLGTALPIFIPFEEPAHRLPTVVAFSLVCVLNCRLISRWDAGFSDYRVSDFSVISAMCICVPFCPLPVGVSVVAAGTLLMLLNLERTRVGNDASRVLADVCLLTPLVVQVFR